MKPLIPVVLLASLAANAVLAWSVLRAPSAPAVSTAPSSATGATTSSVEAVPAVEATGAAVAGTDWAGLGRAGDLTTLVARLRAACVPPAFHRPSSAPSSFSSSMSV